MSKSNVGNIQFLLSQNKQDIRYLEEAIDYLRKAKSKADSGGFLQDEYEAHDDLKYAKKMLKKYVNAQKMLKKMMKGQV